MNKRLLRFISAAGTLAVMIAIFAFSARDSGLSSIDSGRVTRLICRIIFFGFRGMSAENQKILISALHPFVRKLAHFSIYLLLGFFSYAALLPERKKGPPMWLCSLVFCCCYAFLDELHQYFIPGRAMRMRDVMIDTCGALAGIIILRILILCIQYAARRISDRYFRRKISKDGNK